MQRVCSILLRLRAWSENAHNLLNVTEPRPEGADRRTSRRSKLPRDRPRKTRELIFRVRFCRIEQITPRFEGDRSRRLVEPDNAITRSLPMRELLRVGCRARQFVASVIRIGDREYRHPVSEPSKYLPSGFSSSGHHARGKPFAVPGTTNAIGPSSHVSRP